jgi:hypothetical protein
MTESVILRINALLDGQIGKTGDLYRSNSKQNERPTVGISKTL